MAVDCQNIYKNARKSAGMTQEKAAQLLNVSVDSLRDYEQSQRPVPSDVASAMCDVYQAPYLAVLYLHHPVKFALKDFQFLLIDSQYYHLSEYH